MINNEQCPVCGTGKIELQPEVINGRQDVFYECGGAITYDVENPSDAEETGNCENKIDWTIFLVEYDESFDKNAKLVDERFYGWHELQFYKNSHSEKWFDDNLNKNPLDKNYIDEYFENKEIYLKNLKKYNIQTIPVDGQEKVAKIIVKTYEKLGEFVMKHIEDINYKGVDKTIYKILSTKEEKNIKDLSGNYIIENNQNKNIDIYDREIIEVIIKHEVG